MNQGRNCDAKEKETTNKEKRISEEKVEKDIGRILHRRQRSQDSLQRQMGTINMTNKINLVINLSILALLIYLAVAVKQIQDKVFPDPDIMIPLIGMQMDSKTELEYNIRTLLNNALTEAINEQEKQ